MYRIGYIDDSSVQYENYKKKIRRRCSDMELIFLDGCRTEEDFVEKIYLEQIDVLLVDYKMAASFGFNGTTLISYINDRISDLKCFILTAVDQQTINDGLVAGRDRESKTIFDTEGEDPEREQKLREFLTLLKESAEVFRARREQKVSRYKELLEKRKNGTLGSEENEYLNLYKVLSSYGMVERLPEKMLASQFDTDLELLLEIGQKIIESHKVD